MAALGFAADHRHLLRKKPQGFSEFERTRRFSEVRIDPFPPVETEFRFRGRKHAEGPGRLAMLDRIHDNDHLEALHQPQHEMHAADADIHGLNVCGESAGA